MRTWVDGQFLTAMLRRVLTGKEETPTSKVTRLTREGNIEYCMYWRRITSSSLVTATGIITALRFTDFKPIPFPNINMSIRI